MPLSRPLSAAVSLTFALLTSASLAQTPLPPAARAAQLNSAYARLPLSFEPNRGQLDAHAQFMARTPQASIYLSGADALLETSTYAADSHGKPQLAGTSSLRMHLAGAAPAPVASTEQPLSGTINYMRGQDRSHWHTEVPTYGGVRLAAVYPGVDLRYYGHAGQLEYDFIVAPESDPAAIKLQFQGSKAAVESNGDLILPVAGAKDLRFDKPVAYQMIEGKRVAVEASFTLATNQDVSFRLGAYDHTRELVIDPTLLYLGTLGSGIGQTNVSQITVDSAGALYFIGTTNETAYPTTVGAYQPVCGPANAAAAGAGVVYCNNSNNTSAYITKLSADGTNSSIPRFFQATERLRQAFRLPSMPQA